MLGLRSLLVSHTDANTVKIYSYRIKNLIRANSEHCFVGNFRIRLDYFVDFQKSIFIYPCKIRFADMFGVFPEYPKLYANFLEYLVLHRMNCKLLIFS